MQMTTFRVDPAHRVDALGRFGGLFLGIAVGDLEAGREKDD